MTSKLVVNTIEADTGISSVSFASSISMSSTSKFHFGDAGIDIGADTNINRPEAGVLGFNINGGEKVRISSSGKINIGDTQTSQNILNIEDGTAASMEFASHGIGGDTAYIGVKKSTGGGLTFGISNRDIIFKTGASYSGGTAFDGGTERLRIQSNGIVKVESNDSSGLSAHLVVNNSESNSGLSIMGSGSSFSSGGWAAVTDAGIIRSSANSSNGLVMQAASGDMRFYVGGNPPAERLRIDSSGNVGVGTNVASDTTGNCQAFKIARPLNGQVRLILQNSATGFGNGAGYQQGIDGANVFIENRTSGGHIDFANVDSGGTYNSRMRIGSTGIIDAPTQAGFYARMQNDKANVMGGGASYYTIPFDTDSGSVCYDTHNSYNTSNGLYTVPTDGTGHYIVSTAVCLSTSVYGRGGECWFLVGSNRYFFDRRYFTSTGGTITGYYGTINIKLTAGQTIGVQGFVSGGSQDVDVLGANATDQITWFTARKIA